ncbi:MAG: hypothetical protein A3D31_00715 [Candidatus Fluviicola riflensis]|nr:MAG: hypothetical protein CHH17_04830 [Candidatus Fluviicola riflensis]OGS76130.1 MAG: hypothetical protein A3D31_00715 [Candidatus Fluviicola riflensis]OGS83326.1 MAG: hypothetical protein A2724_01125 [Fluviicola sp. RIFCSPHIGHO2_01_FULL_43_53]OGS83662.1 MAG: hypothetical protein A3E30_17320 [Fluviicola sp. RIFCSPHIGHO2_12_FULL_43_24]
MKDRISLLLLFCSCSFIKTIAQTNSEDCVKNLKIGEFRYVGEFGPNSILRDKKKQIERLSNGVSLVVSKVKWLNDFEYELKVKKLMNCPKTTSVKKGDIMRVKITECSSTSYKCTIQYSNLTVADIEYQIIMSGSDE